MVMCLFCYTPRHKEPRGQRVPEKNEIKDLYIWKRKIVDFYLDTLVRSQNFRKVVH
jgi:hypothetical protein